MSKEIELIELLRSKGTYHIKDLAQRLGVSDRQIRNYITKINTQKAHTVLIVKSGKGTYTLDKGLLNDEEFLRQKFYSQLLDAPNHKVIYSISPNNYYKFLSRCLDYIKQKQVVELSYKSYEKDVATQHIISPLYIKEYQNTWFLIAYHHKSASVYTYGLDRIASMEHITTEAYYEDADGSIYNTYKKRYGISNYEEGEETYVELEFLNGQLNYALSKPLHETQKHKAGSSICTYQLLINHEFEQSILALSPNVRVITPLSLQAKLKAKLKEALALYKK